MGKGEIRVRKSVELFFGSFSDDWMEVGGAVGVSEGIGLFFIFSPHSVILPHSMSYTSKVST